MMLLYWCEIFLAMSNVNDFGPFGGWQIEGPIFQTVRMHAELYMHVFFFFDRLALRDLKNCIKTVEMHVQMYMHVFYIHTSRRDTWSWECMCIFFWFFVLFFFMFFFCFFFFFFFFFRLAIRGVTRDRNNLLNKKLIFA